ncbi:MAG: acetyl-CoA carboxylase biotin carboxyl carrier protein [Candidatus Sulfobium sp.]|jgi:acetyl-CoA carboxylase biotin carboxyl carrier protein
MMELEDLKNLIELLKDTDITELQVEKEGTKVRIRREKMFPGFEISAQQKAVIQENIVAEKEEETQRLITVTAPIVGTFYRSPSPEASHFVEPGLQVKKGQVLCIIEAMKLMNEIESEVDGTLVKVLIENGQPVEYGEPLFLIDPL